MANLKEILVGSVVNGIPRHSVYNAGSDTVVYPGTTKEIATKGDIVVSTNGIKYSFSSNVNDLEIAYPAASEELNTMAIVNGTVTGKPNGLYRVELVDTTKTWVFFDALSLQDATEVPFNNTTSGLTSTDVKGAIDELASKAASVANLRGRTVSNNAPTSGQILTWDATNSVWAPSAPATQNNAVTLQGNDVSANAPSEGNVLTWNATLSRWIPAAPSTQDNATKIQGRTVASTAPAEGQALVWDATNTRWVPGTIDVSVKADKVSSATAGNFAGLDASGNLTDSGKKVADFVLAAYTPDNSSNWANPAPTTVIDAINKIAAILNAHGIQA